MMSVEEADRRGIGCYCGMIYVMPWPLLFWLAIISLFHLTKISDRVFYLWDTLQERISMVYAFYVVEALIVVTTFLLVIVMLRGLKKHRGDPLIALFTRWATYGVFTVIIFYTIASFWLP